MRVLRGLTTCALAGLFVLTGWAPRAEAHTELVASSPAAGDRLTKPPEFVELTFSEEVRPELVTVIVTVGGRASGRLPVARGRTASTLVATMPEADSKQVQGVVEWTVAYRVASGDGHPVEGTVVFRAPVAAEASPEPSPSTGESPVSEPPAADDPADAATPTVLTADETRAGDSGNAAIVVIGLIAAIGVAVGCGLLVRARRLDGNG